MNNYLFHILCLLVFSLPVSAQESGEADTLLVDAGFMPESLDSDVDSLLHSWHAQYFTKAEEFCQDDEENVYFTDDVIRERLERLPHLIPMTYNRMVRDCINLYAERRRGLVRYMLGMANVYFPVIEQILAEHDLPVELKYLAVVESALNPMALSKFGASGIWQFMLPTGKFYGLQINSLIDERRDPVKATHAACRYFKDMYAIYGDWHLVLASYNCGPNNVNKAIRRSGGKTDFWKIFPYLPKETRSYVPLFIAAGYIMNYYCDHNLCPVQAILPLATDTVMINRILHLRQVADVLEMDVTQLRALNPQYMRDIVPGHVAPSVLKLPVPQTYAFIDKEDTVFTHRVEELLGNPPADKKERSQQSTREQITHIAAQGENLYTIANLYGVTAQDIRKWNGLGSNRVARGKKLRLYVNNGGVPFASTAPTPTPPTPSATPPAAKPSLNASTPKGEVTYQVQSGDSLYSISKKYPGVTVADLQKANNLPNANIRPGQLLKIPKG
ncbi:MAG: transglycosylase SLT domain-containing protein [Tannerellaceae bacterium]|jgi:membrane-bound lytic murein transglycosylase D|nr:transglycosylase SLT domain-containing protein [Tannerellaceae bacterium]